ncbi:MAG: hypothetical protein PHN42_01335 [Bacilli bacterium]|nr:hypothetical protein [Bacilli bacterium]
MKKIFWGLFFITSGIVVIINQLGYFTNINLFSLLFTIMLLPIFVKSIFRRNFAGIFFPVALFMIIYSNQLNLNDITPIPVLLTAALCSIGFTIIFGKNHNCNNEKFDQIINEQDESEIDFKVSYGASIKYVNTEDLKKANLSCSFGALKVYFDNAKISGDNAIINLDISFSGVEIYIPKEWKVINNVEISLGGIEDKNIRNINYEKTVTLTGKVSLSGLSIFYI